jgi:hypothetical protein
MSVGIYHRPLTSVKFVRAVAQGDFVLQEAVLFALNGKPEDRVKNPVWAKMRSPYPSSRGSCRRVGPML